MYLAIIECLKAANIGIQHISLWNENTVELENQNGYAFPAVFVEFHPLSWKQAAGGVKKATARVSLHIVTETLADPSDGSKFQTQALENFDTIDATVAAVQGLQGDNFNAFQHVETNPDHNHEQVQHDIETFCTEITDVSAAKKRETVLLENVVNKTPPV